MRRIGLLGGMSWHSSLVYYRILNEEVQSELGGLHSCDCILRSVDFAAIESLQRAQRWDDLGALLSHEAQRLVAAGAELLILCTNTLHRVADAIVAAVDVPFIHIADACGDALRDHGVRTVGLLATSYTVEDGAYIRRLRERHGLEVVTPAKRDQDRVHRIIFEELCTGVISESSRDCFRRVMRSLATDGAGAILLGCTEIALLVRDVDAPVPIFDSTRLHAAEAVRTALDRPRATVGQGQL
ncbi:MAG: aspartate/glutamate racemase family protein [Solirubrobacteraceae bacterium]